MSEEKKEVLLEVKHLKKYFDVETNFFGKPTAVLKAVDDVSFKIYKGEALGLVGESGCGKSTIGKMLVDLYKPTAGEILYDGKDISKLSTKERRKYCKDIQLIFQDPYASLNPRMTVGDIIGEPIRINKLMPDDQVEDRVTYLMNCVGLANHQRNRYPHEFSGGQRQRVGIARALAVQPKLIVCDEPVSALDVSIQAQILNLLKQLQKDMGLTYIFITHDLSVVRYFSDDIAVMYLGQMVEKAPSDILFKNPIHPYTKALLSAIPLPIVGEKKPERTLIKGEITSPVNLPDECRFMKRCDCAQECCKNGNPQLREIEPNHFVACSCV